MYTHESDFAIDAAIEEYEERNGIGERKRIRKRIARLETRIAKLEKIMEVRMNDFFDKVAMFEFLVTKADFIEIFGATGDHLWGKLQQHDGSVVRLWTQLSKQNRRLLEAAIHNFLEV